MSVRHPDAAEGRRPRRLAPIALLASLAAAAPAAALPAASVQDDRLAVVPIPEIPARLDLLAATGTRATRIDVLWRDAAPTRPADPADPADPAYRWQRDDAIMRGLRARGIDWVIADIFQAPRWARVAAGVAGAPRPADLAAFAGALARRYNGSYPDPRGGTLPRIDAIEPWNEPNIGRYLTPQCARRGGRLVPTAPDRYARMLAAAGPAIHAASPGTVVVAGAAGPQGGDRRTCARPDSSTGVALLIDAIRRRHVPVQAWSQHLYPIGPPGIAPFFPSFPTLGRLRRRLDRIRPDIPILVDETGYHTAYDRAHRYFVSESQQARWLSRSWSVAARDPAVRLLTWFNLQDNPEWTGGLLRADGTRKPSFAAFAAVAATHPAVPELAP